MEIWHEYADKLGLKNTPNIFVSSAGMVKYGEVSLYNLYMLRIAPAAAAGYDPKKKNSELRFTIARYAASVFLGYSNKLFFFCSVGMNWVPLLSRLHDRAMCSSIDRVVQALMGEEDALEGCVLLMNEAHARRNMNCKAYAEDICRPVPKRYRLFTFFDDLKSDDPIPKYRIEALKDPGKKSARLI